MAISSVPVTRTMTHGVVVTVLWTITEPGGTGPVSAPTSMGRTADPGFLVPDTMSGLIGKITGNL
jgi:hypothetical protein